MGPTFFPENESRKQWVPIYPITGEDYSVAGKSLSRTMLPLRLAWAWTIWKAQGQTIRGKSCNQTWEIRKRVPSMVCHMLFFQELLDFQTLA